MASQSLSPEPESRPRSRSRRSLRHRSRSQRPYHEGTLLQDIVGLQIPGLQNDKAHPVAEALQAQGLTEVWQIEGLSQQIIDEWFPQSTDLLMNLAVKKIQLASAAQVRSEGASVKDNAFVAALDAQAKTMKSMSDRIKKDKKDKKKKRARSRSSSSVSHDDKDMIDVPAALRSYSLGGLNLEHLPDGDTMAKAVAKARTHFEGARKAYIATGPLEERWTPRWMSKDQKPRMSKDRGHPWNKGFAQFASTWWSRALSQLAVQCKLGKETVAPSDFINQFLELCRMEQETGLEQTLLYDAMLWEDMQDKLSKCDRHIDPATQLAGIVPKIESKVEKKIKYAGPKFGGGSKYCSICHKSGHNTDECFKNKGTAASGSMWCSICRKNTHNTEACFLNDKNKATKPTYDRKKGPKGRGKGRR